MSDKKTPWTKKYSEITQTVQPGCYVGRGDYPRPNFSIPKVYMGPEDFINALKDIGRAMKDEKPEVKTVDSSDSAGLKMPGGSCRYEAESPFSDGPSFTKKDLMLVHRDVRRKIVLLMRELNGYRDWVRFRQRLRRKGFADRFGFDPGEFLK